MERGRQVAARGRDVRRGRAGIRGPHRARLEVQDAPGCHFPLRGQYGRIVVGVRAADDRQRRLADRCGPPPASAVAVELDPVRPGRYQRSASPHPLSDRFLEVPGRVETDELPVVLQLRVGQAFVLYEQAIGFRLIPQPDPVGEKRRARCRRLTEVVLDPRRRHHVRAQLDPAIGVPAEYEVEGRVPAVAGAPDLGGRGGDVALGQRAQEVDRVEQIALADAVVADEAGERPEANMRSRMLLKFLTDRLTSIGGQAQWRDGRHIG